MKKTPYTFQNRSFNFGLFYLIAGIAITMAAAFLIPEAAVSKLKFARAGKLYLPSQVMFYILGGITLLCGIIAVAKAGNRKSKIHTACGITVTATGLFLVLLWAAMARRMDVVGLIAQSIRLATPIGLGAMAGIMCERCGVVNIAIEGMMLTAACIGFTATLYTQSMLTGVVFAMIAGGLMALLHAVLSIRLKVDQIVSGTVVNIMAVGLTGFIRKALLLGNDREIMGTLPAIDIPFLADIPILGKMFFRHQPMVYTMMMLVVAIHILLFYTRWGLRTRTVGEHPRAADALGINVFKVRYTNVIIGGMIAGLGGAWFSLETVGGFDEIMTNGKGFIALAAMIFGKWCPAGAVGGALLFGFADALQFKLQISGIDVPYQFLGMIPYIITMVVLAGVIGKAVAPAADGIPYDREN